MCQLLVGYQVLKILQMSIVQMNILHLNATSKYIFIYIIRSNLYIDIVTIPNLLPIINSYCEIRFVLVHKNVDFSDTYTII